MSKVKVVIAVVVGCLVMASPALAQSAPLATPSADGGLLATLFPKAFTDALLVILAASVIDLAFGVALALKTGTFDWSKVGNFYRTNVIPNILGWGVADIVLRLATAYIPNEFVKQLIQTAGAVGLYTAACAGLLGAITDKFTKLRASA